MGIFATKSQACEFSFHQISLCIFPSDIYTACIDLLPVKLVRWVLSEARMTVRIVVPILRQAYWGLSHISSCMTMYPYSLAAWTTHFLCTSCGRHSVGGILVHCKTCLQVPDSRVQALISTILSEEG